MWLQQQRLGSRRQAVNMEGGRRVSSLEDLPSQILDTGMDQLPGQLLDTLGLHLFNEGRGVAGNWEGVAEELGINTTRELEQIRRHAHVEQVFPGRLMLRDWGKKSGSTVFVLLNALRRQGREDCIDIVIKACQDVHSMQLHVKIEEMNGQQRYLSVTTKKDATLAASLENVLSGLPSYIITGPDHKITWQTPACHLKGTQLSLKKGEVTEESQMIVYGRVPMFRQRSQIPQSREENSNCFQDSYNPYNSQSTPVPLNIPVTEPPSASVNYMSTTQPKLPEPLSSLPATYNDLSKQGHGKPFSQTQDFQSLTSNPQFLTNDLISSGPSQAQRQTLLKKPSYSIDESVSHFGNLHSMTALKHGLANMSQLRVASLDGDDTPMKRCDPLRHSADQPSRHVPKVSDYIPHSHPMINFSNLIQNPDKQCYMSSPGQCRKPVPRAKNEDYVSPDSLHSVTGSAGYSGKPMPCNIRAIHVGYDNVPPHKSTPPKPMVKPKPVPCVLQQRKDGYIHIVEKGKAGCSIQGSQSSSAPVLRQQSVPEASPMSVDVTEGEERNRPKPSPEGISETASAPCVVSRDDNGYATFSSQSSLMEVDRDEGSGGNVTFSLPVYNDNGGDGYLSYSGASDNTTTSMESTMESDTSAGHQPSQSGPSVIQQSADGYFGFASATASSSQQSVPAPHACASTDYVDMGRSESLPNMSPPERNPDGLIYARFSEEDEEEDADYFDMQQLPNIQRNKPQTNINRHWSEGDIEYLDIEPTTSQYDYITENEQSKLRALPPRTHPVPMKRRRFRSQDPENQVQTHVGQPGDLDTVPGWCPHETEESICSTMSRYQQEDGNFIVWWMGRKKRYVVTVSHMNELRHYAIYERLHGSKMRLFIFGGGDEFDSLKSLVEHYMKEGLKGPDVPSGHSRGKRWQQFSHVRLRKPLKVKYTHTVMRKKAT